MKRLVAAIALAAFAASFAAAAETPARPANAAAVAAPAAKPSADDKPAPVAPASPPPPYEAHLLRLVEMIGALAYLRDLCGAGDGAQFRSRMEALVQAEGLADSTRDLMAGAYNEAYRSYAQSYRSCTPAASEVIGRFLTETARLAADVANRYGG